MTDQGLKPCPFCGKGVEWGDYADEKDYLNCISCRSCDIVFSFHFSSSREKKGGYADSWNTRPQEDKARAEVIQECRDMLRSYSEAYSASDISDSYVDCRNIDIALKKVLTKLSEGI